MRNKDLPLRCCFAGVCFCSASSIQFCAVYVPFSLSGGGGVPHQIDDAVISRLNCGSIALLAAFDEMDQQAGQVLLEYLAEDPRADQPTSSFRDLADWAIACGQHPVALHVPSAFFSELKPPFIAHLRPNHFAAVLAWEKDRVQISDRVAASRWIPRGEFDEWCSGFVLCFERGSGLHAGLSEAGQRL